MLYRLFQGTAAMLAVALVWTPVNAQQSRSRQSPGARLAAVSAAAAPAASMRKIALGVSMLPSNSSANYSSFKSSTGRAPATWSIWSDWASAANPSAFPTDQVTALKGEGVVPFIWWQPVGRNSPPGMQNKPLEKDCGVAYSRITGGTHDWDGYIHDWASAAASTDTKILVRFAHEMDGGWFPFGYTRCTNTAASFKAMWRYVVNKVRAIAPKVQFVWSPLNAGTKSKKLYPGNAYVDYVGFTVFNWAQSKNLPWLDLVSGVKRATAGLSSFAGGKPWILAETGSVRQAGRSRPAWLTSGYSAVYKQVPNVTLIVYFNIDMRERSHNQPNWLLGPSDYNAYQSLLNKARFQGTLN